MAGLYSIRDGEGL
ncbi:hypothetical protein D031_4672A, partial [Vibrio parahaemolyticus VP-48]